MNVYLLLYVALTPVMGLLCFIGRQRGMEGWRPVGGWLQAIAFLLLGIGQYWDLRRRRLTGYPAAGWTITALLSIEILILLSALYLFAGTDLLPLALVSICAFSFPFVAISAVQAWDAIPQKKYKIWFLPEHQTFTMPRGKALAIRMKIRLGYFDIGEQLLDLNASARVRVGQLFTHLVAEREKNGLPPIEAADEERQPYGWEFYHCRYGLFGRFLDPQWTLEENGVGNKGIIVVRRVRRGSGIDY